MFGTNLLPFEDSLPSERDERGGSGDPPHRNLRLPRGF